MSNLQNSELLDRTGDLLDNSLITDSQVSVIKTMVHNNDIEGLYFALPKIEQDIKERFGKQFGVDYTKGHNDVHSKGLQQQSQESTKSKRQVDKV